MKGLCGNCCEQWAEKTCYNYDWKWMTIDLCEVCYECREIENDDSLFTNKKTEWNS